MKIEGSLHLTESETQNLFENFNLISELTEFLRRISIAKTDKEEEGPVELLPSTDGRPAYRISK